jgi:hypothetical protein
MPTDAFVSLWLYAPTEGRFVGYAPNAPTAVNDYTVTTIELEAVFVCVRAASTFTQPGVQP